MVIMGVDPGLVRSGVAFCDKSETLASPAGNIEERDEEKLLQKIAALAAERGAQQIVIGYPLNMNGTAGPRAEKCRDLAERLKPLTSAEVVLWDERSTTVSAYAALNDGNVKKRKKKGIVDSTAAAIILDSYLAYRRNREEREV